jgi:hypothetical protein
MDKRTATEIVSLAAQMQAVTTIIVHVLRRVRQTDPKLAAAISLGFDDAASFAENFVFKRRKTALPEHVVKALGIIEELRTATLGNKTKPKHGV